jgi:endonuclease/exonuclease/phosphatase family metal-dependent hydrolase
VPKLRVCTWNVNLGRRLEAVLETAGRFPDLDVLALQEASQRDGVDDAALIAERLGSDYVARQVTAQRVGGRAQANALVWNRARVTQARFGSLELPSMRALELPALERRLLARLREQRRGAVRLEGCFGADLLRVYSVHLDVVGFAHRVAQLASVLSDHAERAEAPLTIVAGDLNTFGVGSRPSWSALHAEARTAGFVDVTTGVGWTYVRGKRLRQKLDAILVRARPGLRHRAWTLASTASDHLPVFAEVEW